jgi:RNA polymerase sigma-32 factor
MPPESEDDMRSPSTSANALTRYRFEVARASRLSPEVETELAKRYRSGDRTVAARLVEGCLDAVIVIALEYRRWGTPIEDLIQEGNIGLLKALDRFDPERGVRLATYARFWIRSQIRELVARQYRIVQLGASKAERRALRLYRKTHEQCPQELAAMSGLSVERAANLLAVIANREVSMSADPEEGRGAEERIADHGRSPEEALAHAVEEHDLRARVTAALAELSVREQAVAHQRLLADTPTTLAELGQAWGVSRERVRQIEEATKTHLRSKLTQQHDATPWTMRNDVVT